MAGSGDDILKSLDDTSDLICFAKLAEQAERYDDMAKAMKKVTEKEKTLQQDLVISCLLHTRMLLGPGDHLGE